MEQILQDLITLTGLSEQDYQVLSEYADITQKWADEIVKEFYDTLFGHKPTAEVFREGERPDREVTLRNWYLEVTSGKISSDFWRRQWLVGLVHIPRKVSNRFMFGMMSRVQQIFLRKCLEAFEPLQAERIYSAFKRLTDVVAGLIAESYYLSYIEAMEHVGGLRMALIQRMIDVEITQKIGVARKQG
jgi:hypothetical protein